MRAARTILVTGGAGFIGSALCRHLVERGGYRVINVDRLTYAGNLSSLAQIEAQPNYRFIQADIADQETIGRIMAEEMVDAIMHLAAESHVDRSIDGPAAFIDTNMVGTFRLLQTALAYWRTLDPARRAAFRFHHVSTDEVFGDLPFESGTFTEGSAYKPSSPYSASKAASDHLARAWQLTYGLPVVISTSSNNYGPFHTPEKLIPLVILQALHGLSIPVYGTGANVRDWLYVDDHVRALEAVMTSGRPGETYLIGGRAERTNLQVVQAICDRLDRRAPMPDLASRRDLIRFVPDRPGHDRRYAVDPAKIESELGWRARESFESGLDKTIDWFVAHPDWWRPLREVAAKRLGLPDAACGQLPAR
ncbi:MAG TPA: dTDP-glucose 4,6-dehydratase [Allosphingosinicella sp.]|jgi:dTDP-glucose 4,6-dehydratase